jgi:glutathione synthase/RimK-type ligase-like ATP-grasp enzyme
MRNHKKPVSAPLHPLLTQQALSPLEKDYQQALGHIKEGKPIQAIRVLTGILKQDPAYANALATQALLLDKHGNKPDLPLKMLQAAVLQLPDRTDLFLKLSEWLAKKGDLIGAASALKRCVTLQPNNADIKLKLAAMYGNLGKSEQRAQIAQASTNQTPVQIEKALVESKLTIMVLRTAIGGDMKVTLNTFGVSFTESHNNLMGLIDRRYITLVKVYVDALDDKSKLLKKLPKADLIYNNITDAERGELALQQALRICDALSAPVVNHPSAVLAASREGNYQHFKDHATIILPKAVKIENVNSACLPVITQAMTEHGFTLPVIVRLAGYQGGKFMHLVEDLASHDFSELDKQAAQSAQTVYLIQYHNVSYTDERAPQQRLYPKYRAFMVGGVLYPVHLFTAADFNVHKKNSDPIVQANPWLVEQEKAYCNDPLGHIGKAQWLALEQAMQEMGLDYVGVDFAPATDPQEKEKIVVFELNPAMRNWVQDLPDDDHVQHAWRKITQAAHHMLTDKANVPAWAFDLPDGRAMGGINGIHDPDLEKSLHFYAEKVKSGKIPDVYLLQYLTLAISHPAVITKFKETFQTLSSIRVSKKIAGAAGVFQTLNTWKEGDMKGLEVLLGRFSYLITLPREAAIARMQIYLNFLWQLFKARKENSHLYDAEKASGKLVVIGESHSLSACNAVFPWQGKTVKADNRFIVGIKMFHLYNPQSSHHASLLAAHLKELQDDTPVLFTIGEIDCRPDEGFWRVAQKDKSVNMDTLVRGVVKGYIGFIEKNIPHANTRSISIQGIPAPQYNLESYKAPGNEAEFLALLKLVNQVLKEETLQRHWNFLDVYAATVDAAGYSNRRWHVDANHISPLFYAEADSFALKG